jgi:hypothetical protein
MSNVVRRSGKAGQAFCWWCCGTREAGAVVLDRVQTGLAASPHEPLDIDRELLREPRSMAHIDPVQGHPGGLAELDRIVDAEAVVPGLGIVPGGGANADTPAQLGLGEAERLARQTKPLPGVAPAVQSFACHGGRMVSESAQGFHSADDNVVDIYP